jgi:dipeptidyl aminopeptidase/acylaminoacyl peptidase
MTDLRLWLEQGAGVAVAPSDRQLAAVLHRADVLRARRSMAIVGAAIAVLLAVAIPAAVFSGGDRDGKPSDRLRTTDADTRRLLGGPDAGTGASTTVMSGAGATPTTSARRSTVAGGTTRTGASTPAEGSGAHATVPAATPTGGVAPVPSPGAAATGPIVYASNRDGNWEIYRLDPGAAAPVRLTSSPADDAEPAWSPDHRRIAFVRSGADGKGDVYTMAADGSGETRLTDDPNDDRMPAWSPDGRRIAFTSDRLGEQSGGIRYGADQTPQRTPELWVMDADGRAPRRLVASPGAVAIANPDWSPDGSLIVFDMANDSTAGTDIDVVEVATGNVTVLLADGAFDREPVWSPDGTHLAFRIDQGSSSQLAVMDARGTDVHRITTGAAFSFLPSWSHDGLTILYSRDVDGPRYRYSGGVECAAVRGDPTRPADVCPTGPAASELWTVRFDGAQAALFHGEVGSDVADGSW